MKTFKQYILEKLKVSTKDTVTMTNEEFFELLKQYCKINNKRFLDLNLLSIADLLPRHKQNKNRIIFTLRPSANINNPEIIIQTRDFETFTQDYCYYVSIKNEGDKTVNFMDDAWIEKIIKFILDEINK